MATKWEDGRDGEHQVRKPEAGQVKAMNKIGEVASSEPKVEQLRAEVESK